MNTTGKILTAFAVGAAAGAIMGLLFAPAKGSETRQNIGDQGKRFASSLKQKFSKAKETVNDLKDELAKATNDAVNSFEEA